MQRHYLIYALCILGALLLGLALIKQFAAVLDQPQVHFSYPSDECVRVRDFKAEAEGRPSEWSCDNLPAKYEKVWVP